MTDHQYRRIRVSGDSHQRGVQYGTAARDEIRIGKQAYERTFENSVGWSWAQARDATAHLVDPVKQTFPQYLTEMEGIAEGAEMPFEDIFTMNCRTEVIWAATVRKSEAAREVFAHECSSFVLMPERTASGHTLLGQNWDWLAHCVDSLVVLEVEQPDLPNFVTAVEAGLLAKTSLNSAGLGVAVNALVTSADSGASGIPFHVLIRAFADCETLSDAIHVATQNERSSSGNYLLAHADGVAVNLEATPGDYRGVTPQLPENGVLVHTNHFTSLPAGSVDVAHHAMADSLVRLQQVERKIAGATEPATLDSLHAALADHANYPSSVCSHPDERDPDWDQWRTVTSMVMDLDERTMYLSEGNPCEHPHEAIDFGDLLHKPSRREALRAVLDS